MPEALFSFVSLAASVAWLLLALAAPMPMGAARRALLFAAGRGAPVALCAVCMVLLARYWGTTPGGGFRSLGTVLVLLSAPGKMLGAWTHFLAFDLLVGRWMVDDASVPGNARLALVAALPATFLFGPFGLLLYLTGRSLLRSRASP
ncbi:MAG: DUF4281 domain-containing protein [Alicycliphilus sp.]|jgi:hypothetical protein|nr:MAG: DUF4281 domain-containing protein [Alicycliphilus sp.]